MSGIEQAENNLHNLLLMGIQGEEAHRIEREREKLMSEFINLYIYLYDWLPENSVWVLDSR